MKIIYRYTICSLIKWFLLVESFVIVFYLFISLITHTKYIEQYSAKFSEILVYDLLKLPYAIYQTIPVAMSCSTVIVMILMLKYNEIMVCITSGLRVVWLIIPFFIVSFFLCLFMIISGDYINPVIEKKRNHYKSTIIENKNNIVANKLSNLWFKEDNNTFIYIGTVDPVMKRMTDIKLYHIDKNFKLLLLTKVESAQYIDYKWNFDGITKYKVEKTNNSNLNYTHIKDTTFDNVLKLSLNSPKSLRIRDLMMMIRFYKISGLDTRLYKLVLYKKFSYPISVVALVLLMFPCVLNFLGIFHNIL